MTDTPANPETDALREIVSFSVADQRFCIEIEHVLEIRGWTGTTVLPHAPEFVIGMMNLRGTVLPVVDLSLRLGLGKAVPSPRHVIIIARILDQTAGLLVANVSDILTVREAEMQPTPDVASAKTQSFLKGVYMIDEEVVRAVDVHRMLPRDEADAA